MKKKTESIDVNNHIISIYRNVFDDSNTPESDILKVEISELESLNFIRLIFVIQDELEVNLTISEINQTKTLKHLAVLILEKIRS
ncbi:hypothetical protein SDA16_13685 [Legionella pneumophila serogroup 1]|uniref:hypothetical protein n=1 Tax=Legionella pneumophila TaxID=446 RepID=UPI000778179E|nr:hypothetical protein [Legionella pneumophila]HAT8623653.1 hypothetical protein [Legionella pneumophila]HAU1410269.1 hypothetical protein [Legionella pneumophila]HCC3170249.1 hypothetical protein [Legionella pneumophila]HCC3179479.1 hypothetical protein [Legionella pneumophila]HCC3185429.1 hypothetical protein [Legionella pneumophila]